MEKARHKTGSGKVQGDERKRTTDEVSKTSNGDVETGRLTLLQDKSRGEPTLVQIRFSKTLYFGQHNEGGTQINPIMLLNTLSLGVSRAYMEPFDPVILDSKMNG